MTPSSSSVPLAAIATPTIPAKRNEPPLTPATSIDDNPSAGRSAPEVTPAKLAQPPKKKRRLVLTKVGDIDS